MITLSIIVEVCIWDLGFHKIEAHGVVMGYLEFGSFDFLLLDVIVELHAMNENKFNVVCWKEVGFYM